LLETRALDDSQLSILPHRNKTGFKKLRSACENGNAVLRLPL